MNDPNDNARQQALAQLESIRELVSALGGSGDAAAQEEILNDALSVEVRGPWYVPFEDPPDDPEEFRVLLCTGGPAVRIVGRLHDGPSPVDPRIEYQDWGTPWTTLEPLSDDDRQNLQIYCDQFYFGG